MKTMGVGLVSVALLMSACGSTGKAAPANTVVVTVFVTNPPSTAPSSTVPAPPATDPLRDAANVCTAVPANSVVSGTGTHEALLHCGMVVDQITAGYTIQITTVREGAADALHTFGVESGCFTDADIARMSETRALDGMVSSSNKRSTWTYHPNNGLQIVCND